MEDSKKEQKIKAGLKRKIINARGNLATAKNWKGKDKKQKIKKAGNKLQSLQDELESLQPTGNIDEPRKKERNCRKAPVPGKNAKPRLGKHTEEAVAESPKKSAPKEEKSMQQFIEDEFEPYYGLDDVKKEIKRFAKTVRLDKIREKRGRKPKAKSYHMIFLGPPGTGKTTVAKIVANLLLKLGITKSKKVTTINNPLMLVSSFVGKTASKTMEHISRAAGGVFFLDEAYRLSAQPGQRQNSHSAECVETIMGCLDPNNGQDKTTKKKKKSKAEKSKAEQKDEDEEELWVDCNKTVFIFAGYQVLPPLLL